MRLRTSRCSRCGWRVLDLGKASAVLVEGLFYFSFPFLSFPFAFAFAFAFALVSFAVFVSCTTGLVVLTFTVVGDL
jgi:hypothetical protein